MDEVWKKIYDNNKYYVSNLGGLKRVDNTGALVDVITAHNPYGYLTFKMLRNGKQRTIFLHVEVAKAFIDNPENLEDVHHIDYNKSNCRVDNLMWMSHSDNMKDYYCTTSNPRYLRTSNGKYIKIKPDSGKCIDCGAKIWKYSKRCRSCAAKADANRYNNGKPLDKVEIFKIIKGNNGNFSKSAKHFNMSDNALRKWCSKYGLPTHSEDWK